MSKIIGITLALFLFASFAFAQVKIGGEPTIPHASAVLELDGGSSRGLLLPRMRKMDMLAMENPAEGLTVYLTDEQATYLRRSANWVKLSGVGDAFSLPYENHFNYAGAVLSITNQAEGETAFYGAHQGKGYGVRGIAPEGIAINGVSDVISTGIAGLFTHTGGGRSLVSMGKTGIGIPSPEGLMHIRGYDIAGTTIVIDDDSDPTIQFRKMGINKSYIKQQGNNLVFRPNDQNSSGKVVMQSYNDGGWLFLDAAGNTSFGINPEGFSGTPLNSRVNIAAPTDRPTLTLESPLVNGAGPSLEFVFRAENQIIDIGTILATGSGMIIHNKYGKFTTLAGNSVWKNDGATNNQMYLRSKDDLGILNVTRNVSIGEFSEFAFPSYALSIKCDPAIHGSNAFTVDAVDPLLRLQNSGVDKGYMQAVGDDLKIGTFASNDLGNFVIRTNGADRVVVRPDGKMVLGSSTGTAPAGNHLLAVKGRIAATEFSVTAIAAWPDYVFAPGYQLKSLEETEAFIKQNKHLPNIPAASVVEKEGFDLADMQKRLIEKVEELTLHLIEANKQIQLLKKQVAEMK